MKRKLLTGRMIAILGLPLLCNAGAAAVPPELDRNNVVWDSPGGDSSGSMPIGNGDAGMNVWVEDNGDLLLLLGKSDAWDENHRLLKLGRVRISLAPSPFAKGQPFRQELKLREGVIEVAGGMPGKETVARIWVDANRPVIHVECAGPDPSEATVKLELWRTEKRPFGKNEMDSCWQMYGWDGANRPKDLPCYVTPDTVVDAGKDRLVWYHRNAYSVWPIGMKRQGLESLMAQQKDPLLDRTFGGAMGGDGMERRDAHTLKSGAPAKSHHIAIHVLTAQTPTPEAWRQELDRVVKAAGGGGLTEARAGHREWWAAFWNRSWVLVSGNKEADAVTRAYALQRWVSACAGRGAYPIKFNGSIFTVEKREKGKVVSDPDFRAWGGDYWWQNTRLPHWPMLASGDHDMMRPLFRMYGDTLELARARNKIWFNCDGAFSAETMSIWGGMANGDYGWKREGRHVSDVANPYVQWYWTSGLELSFMMLDYHAYTQDEKFLREEAIPWSDALLLFFDTHFKRDAAGKLRLDPIQALETYQSGVVNDMPNVAALHAVLDRLLALPVNLAGGAMRRRWERLRQEIPELPAGMKDGRKVLLPAEKFAGRKNCENPELYAVFPFRLYGVGKPDLELARDTFAVRVEKARNGWQQNPMQAALLGLAADARNMLTGNAISKHPGSRFPAFWGPNYDWIPDQDHGGNILNTAQLMLMQCEGRRIILLPAWPKNWDAEFKLHAPLNTTVEGVVKGGKLLRFEVTPRERAGDVKAMPAQ